MTCGQRSGAVDCSIAQRSQLTAEPSASPAFARTRRSSWARRSASKEEMLAPSCEQGGITGRQQPSRSLDGGPLVSAVARCEERRSSAVLAVLLRRHRVAKASRPHR